MKKRSRVVRFFVSILVIVSILGSFLVGGYFLLDKSLVPKYFSKYGIDNLSELVSMVKALYVIPDENEFITNPYSVTDETSAVNILKEAGLPVLEGTSNIDYNKIAKNAIYISADSVTLTSKEMAAVLNQMLNSGALSSNLSGLDYFDTLNITVKEMAIKAKNYNSSSEIFQSASITTTIKIDTESARKQMAKSMDMPVALLDLIMPKIMYLTAVYDVDLNEEGGWDYNSESATLGINGRDEKQSEILISLLLSFIFSKEENMDIPAFTETIGGVLKYGLQVLGEVQFVNEISSTVKQSGIIVTIPH